MFVIGELVHRDKRVGLVTQTKHMKCVQYCKVLWANDYEQDWVCSNDLHEIQALPAH